MKTSLNWRPIISHEKFMDRCGQVSAYKTLRKKMEEAGVKFIDLPDAELARWKDATKTVGEKVKDIIPLEKQERIKSLIK